MSLQLRILALVLLGLASPSCGKPGAPEVFIIKSDESDKIRNKIQQYKQSNEIQERNTGWSVSKSRNPIEIVKIFRSLDLQSGYTLKKYQWIDSLGGASRIIAIKSDQLQPDPAPDSFVPNPSPNVMAPSHFPKTPVDETKYPKYGYMQAITGDYTPISYYLASIMILELEELGAIWHGKMWDDEFILNGTPEDHRYYLKGIIRPTESMKDLNRQINKNRKEAPYPIIWNYKHKWPEYWTPYVLVNDENISVSFVAYTARDQSQLNIYTFKFHPRSYIPKEIRRELLATGNGSYFQY